jgi:hypothetical protein
MRAATLGHMSDATCPLMNGDVSIPHKVSTRPGSVAVANRRHSSSSSRVITLLFPE